MMIRRRRRGGISLNHSPRVQLPPQAQDGVSGLVLPDWRASVVAPAIARALDTTVGLIMQSGHKSDLNCKHNFRV